MTISFVGHDTCRGCGHGVNVWFDGVRHVIRNRSMTWSPIHCCDDPEKREHIELDFMDLIAFRCPKCGDQECAPTSWDRVVDFPCDPDLISWAEAWVGPLQEHVCTIRRPDGRPVRGLRVWTNGASC